MPKVPQQQTTKQTTKQTIGTQLGSQTAIRTIAAPVRPMTEQAEREQINQAIEDWIKTSTCKGKTTTAQLVMDDKSVVISKVMLFGNRLYRYVSPNSDRYSVGSRAARLALAHGFRTERQARRYIFAMLHLASWDKADETGWPLQCVDQLALVGLTLRDYCMRAETPITSISRMRLVLSAITQAKQLALFRA